MEMTFLNVDTDNSIPAQSGLFSQIPSHIMHVQLSSVHVYHYATIILYFSPLILKAFAVLL